MGSVTLSGPIFDGRSDGITFQFCEEISRQTARSGEIDVHSGQTAFYKNPTGHYESHIRIDRFSTHSYRIWDGGQIVYGPWLEGVGSRNKSTRFKGYWIFRVVAQALGRKADRIAESLLPKYVGRLNGGS